MLLPVLQVILPGLQVIPDRGTSEMTPALEAIFGNRTAAWTLLFLQSYGDGYAKRIADTFGISVNLVQSQLRRLEDSGVLVSREVGRTRVFTWNPRSLTVRSLRNFLEAELERIPKNVTQRYFRQRQRPRRSGKPD